MSHERKFYDINTATSSAFTGGTSCWETTPLGVCLSATGPAGPPPVTPLNNLWLTQVSQGTGVTNRIGSQISADQLLLRYWIVPNPQNTGVRSLLRLVIYTDNECDGSYPAITDVFTGWTGASADNIFQFLELGYGGRFTILKDTFIPIKTESIWSTSGLNEVETGYQMKEDGYFEHVIDLKGHKIEWDTSGNSAITNARRGHIFWMAMWKTETQSAGVITTAYTNPPHIQMRSRLRFRDTNSA